MCVTVVCGFVVVHPVGWLTGNVHCIVFLCVSVSVENCYACYVIPYVIVCDCIVNYLKEIFQRFHSCAPCMISAMASVYS